MSFYKDFVKMFTRNEFHEVSCRPDYCMLYKAVYCSENV